MKVIVKKDEDNWGMGGFPRKMAKKTVKKAAPKKAAAKKTVKKSASKKASAKRKTGKKK